MLQVVAQCHSLSSRVRHEFQRVLNEAQYGLDLCLKFLIEHLTSLAVGNKLSGFSQGDYVQSCIQVTLNKAL